MRELAPLHPTHATETTPLYVEAALALVLAADAAKRGHTPFAARVCGRCGATGKQPCVTASGKVMRRFHVARG